jgi:hypothetical protein
LVHLQKPFGTDMRRRMGWLKHHRFLAFFVLAYAISWASWPVYAAGLMPRMEFLPVGPLAAAVIVIALAEGRPGFRAWGRRLIRWHVGWTWYAVALLLPVVLVPGTGFITMALGAAAPGLAQLTWTGLLALFAVRLVNPLDGALVTLWHPPLVLFGGSNPIGLVMAALGWWIMRTGAPAAAASDPAIDGQTVSARPRLSPPGS